MRRVKLGLMGIAGKRVLVTGANSFIACHLLPCLVECGAKIVAVAPDLGWRPWVAKLVEDGRITFVEADALTQDGVEQLAPYLAVTDCVVHLARVWAQGSMSLELAVDETERNVLGSIRFLAKAAQYGLRIVYPSSVEVYGPPERLPLQENHPLRPVSSYAVAKSAVEGFLSVQGAKEGTPIVILRYATVYGPGELEPRAVPNFIRAVLTDSPPVVDGEGRDIRDYVYIADVVNATLQALGISMAGIRVYNVGTGISSTTIDLARLIIRLAGTDLEPVHRPSDHIPLEIVCDISKALAELGYSPAYTLEEGLATEIQWFRDNPNLWQQSSQGYA